MRCFASVTCTPICGAGRSWIPPTGRPRSPPTRSCSTATPDSPAAARAQVRIAELQERFAYKEYRAAIYYFRLKAYDSAILYLKDLVATYPRAAIAPDALVKLVQAYREAGLPGGRAGDLRLPAALPPRCPGSSTGLSRRTRPERPERDGRPLRGVVRSVHHGHLIVGQVAAETLGLESLRFVPAREQPFKRGLHGASAEHARRCWISRWPAHPASRWSAPSWSGRRLVHRGHPSGPARAGAGRRADAAPRGGRGGRARGLARGGGDPSGSRPSWCSPAPGCPCPPLR